MRSQGNFPVPNVRGILRFLQQVLPLKEIGNSHAEGLPACFFCSLFIVCTDSGIIHRHPCVDDRLPEALAVRLLRPAPLDIGHIGRLHDRLLAIRPAISKCSHLAAHTLNGWVEDYFNHGSLYFLISWFFSANKFYMNSTFILY